MRREEAERKMRRKATRLKPCPFCGSIPKVNWRCDTEHSKHGSWGHYTKREQCCRPTCMGQTELFFTNNFEGPNYRLWWMMFSHLIDNWNQRQTSSGS